MKKQLTQYPEITLVGLTLRTNNQNEMSPEHAKIGALAGSYWGGQQANDILHRSKPGVNYAVYTDFESDEHGDYTHIFLVRRLAHCRDKI